MGHVPSFLSPSLSNFFSLSLSHGISLLEEVNSHEPWAWHWGQERSSIVQDQRNVETPTFSCLEQLRGHRVVNWIFVPPG